MMVGRRPDVPNFIFNFNPYVTKQLSHGCDAELKVFRPEVKIKFYENLSVSKQPSRSDGASQQASHHPLLFHWFTALHHQQLVAA